MNFKELFKPHFLTKPSVKIMALITVIQLVLFFCLTQFNSNELIPKPTDVLQSMVKVVTADRFLDDFISTISLIFSSMGLAIIISTVLVYLSFIPVFGGISKFVSILRFLTYTGLLFVFTMILKDSHEIKVSLFLFGIIPYFVTSLLSYVKDIPNKEFELCYTLKFNNWQTLYEVVIRGKLHLLLEVIKQNFAIAWMMITSVEGLSMSEGGLGTLMIKSNKYLHISDVFGVLLLILIIGIFLDYFFDVLKVWLFPYTDTKRYSNLFINKLTKK